MNNFYLHVIYEIEIDLKMMYNDNVIVCFLNISRDVHSLCSSGFEEGQLIQHPLRSLNLKEEKFLSSLC